MKTIAKKSSSKSSSTAARSQHQPFFAKSGGGNFFRSAAPANVQMKMTVNKPGDKFEQEANKMSDNVIRMPAPPSPEEKLQRQEEDRIKDTTVPEEKIQKQDQEEETVQMAELPEEQIQKQEKEEETVQAAELPEEQVQKQKELQQSSTDEERLQRKGIGVPSISSNTQSTIRNKTAGGQPLSSDVRGYMEPRFETDFSDVRIHNDPESEGLSNQLQARAFTYQNHIFFSRDQYQPGTSEGKKLIAHELTHTLQQGAVTRRKLDISKGQTPSVQRGALDWIRNKIKRGLNWAADRLVPGYTLLNVILGKNLITDEPVSRTGINIIKGYMRLSPVIGSILLNELEDTKTLPEAGIWVEAQVKRFGINFNDMAKRLELMWGEMSVWRGIDYNVGIFIKYLSPVLNKFIAFSGVVMGKVKELRFEGALRLVGATQLLAAMKKDPAAFKRLVDNPKTILKYFMSALKQGFSRFKNNFGLHFKNAIFGWLFGKAAEMGIQIPKEFSAAGFFHLVAQLVGATYQQIRMQVVKKIGPRGEAIVSKLEKTVEIIKDLAVRGPIALWERMQSFLKGFKEMVFAKISGLITFEIIKAAVTKLVSMLNPAGAIVQLVLGIYRVVKFFIDRWETIKQITTAILDSITNVALGNISAAAGYIEKTMAKGITLVISFLASIFGLGGIVSKVRNLIKKISAPVQLAIGKVVGWAVEKGKILLKKMATGVLQVGVPKDPQLRAEQGIRAAAAVVNRLPGNRIGEAVIRPALSAIKTRYGFTRLYPELVSGRWWVAGDLNPKPRKPTQKSAKDASNSAVAATLPDQVDVLSSSNKVMIRNYSRSSRTGTMQKSIFSGTVTLNKLKLSSTQGQTGKQIIEAPNSTMVEYTISEANKLYGTPSSIKALDKVNPDESESYSKKREAFPQIMLNWWATDSTKDTDRIGQLKNMGLVAIDSKGLVHGKNKWSFIYSELNKKEKALLNGPINKANMSALLDQLPSTRRDELGATWKNRWAKGTQIHHIKPLNFGGDNVNFIPLSAEKHVGSSFDEGRRD